MSRGNDRIGKCGSPLPPAPERKESGKPRGEQGLILFIVLIVALVAGIIVSAALGFSHTAVRLTRQFRVQDECFFLAQSAMERAKWNIYQAFLQYFNTAPLAHTRLKFPWFDSYGDTWVGSTNRYNAPQGADYQGGKIWVTIERVQATRRPDQRILELKVHAQIHGVDRYVSEYVSYEMAPARVFDYAYFINNFGWFWGSTITANGEVRSNGNFSFRYNPTVNGDALAALNPDLGADGTVSGNWQHSTLSDYYNNAGPRLRPGNPPNSNYDGEWPMGYDGTPNAIQRTTPLDMPYLGDLSDYRWLAHEFHGKIKIGGTTVVNEVYNGPGPDGVSGTPDDGSLVLVGTQSHPIVVNGPVVVPGDVIIKGVVHGQGTIYAGRNIHIIGDITYKDPPSWSHPDNHPTRTINQNNSADMLALAAKGNIVLGDYTSSDWQNNVAPYIRPNFTQAYDTDPSDDDIGYDSDHNPNNGSRFDGNYTAYDGGKKINRYGHVRNRRYYECSNEQAFKSANPTNDVHTIDAVCYTNHLFGGRVKRCNFNGGIVSRDEAIIFTNWVHMNWDIRLGSRSNDARDIDIYLPRTMNKPRTMYWREF